MPIYEYECCYCKFTEEKLQGINDDPLIDCPVCNKNGLLRIVSSSNFHLKGNGWYKTDFKNKK